MVVCIVKLTNKATASRDPDRISTVIAVNGFATVEINRNKAMHIRTKNKIAALPIKETSKTRHALLCFKNKNVQIDYFQRILFDIDNYLEKIYINHYL